MANVLRHALVKVFVTIIVWIVRAFALAGDENSTATILAGNHSHQSDPAPVLLAEGDNLALVTRSFRGQVQWYKDDHSLELMRRLRKQDYNQLNVTTSWNETTGENILQLYNVSQIHSGNYSCVRTHYYPDGKSKHFWIIVVVRSKKVDHVNVQSKKVDQSVVYNGSMRSSRIRPSIMTFKQMALIPLALTASAGRSGANPLKVVSLEQSGALSYEYFANHTASKSRTVGDTFKMECQIEGHSDSSAVHWDKDGKNFSEWHNNRIQLQNNNLLLVIKPVQCSDAGVYTCTVNTSRGILYDRRDLNVELGMKSVQNIDKYDCQKDPGTHFIEYTAVGQDLQLKCAQSPGHSDLRTGRKWQKRMPNRKPTCDNPEPFNYDAINATDPEWLLYDTYVKKNVTLEDAGSYRCIAKELGPTVSSEHDLVVYCVVVLPFFEGQIQTSRPEVQPSIQIAEGPSVAWTAIASAIVLAVLLLALTGYLVYRRVKPQPLPYHDSLPISLPNTATNNPIYPFDYPWLPVLPNTPEIGDRRTRETRLGPDSSDDTRQREPLINGEPNDSLRPPAMDGLVRAEIKIGQFESTVPIDPNDNAFVPSTCLRLTRRQLGKGAFGEVWEGTLVTETDTVRVAAKRLNEKCVEEESLHEIIQECRLMQSMAPHENVLRCLGFCITSKNLHLLTEFAANGNLKTYMESHKDDVGQWNYERPVATDFITACDLLNFSWQIAKGMRYLAEINIVHRDLAARNVLVNEHKILKIADFGLSRRMTSKNYYRLQKQKRLPMKWMAPESLTECIFDSKSDVWSFGVVMWEIAAFGQDPYNKLFTEKHIVAKTHQCMASVLRNSVRLPAPPHATSEMYSIMQSCWTYDAERRPAFPALEQQLNALCNSDEQIHPYTLLSGPPQNQGVEQESAAREASTLTV